MTIQGQTITFPSTTGNTAFTATVQDLSLLGTATATAQLNSTTLSSTQTLNVNGTFTITGNDATHTATATVKTININSGGILDLNTYGAIGVATGVTGSAINILSGGTANLSADMITGATISRNYNNSGTTTETGKLSAGATITNKTGATFNVSGTGEIDNGTFVNQSGATLAKIGGGQSDLKLAVTNNSGGSININSGLLQLNSTVDNSGNITVTNANAGNQLHTLTGTVTNQSGGLITVQNGASWINDSAFTATTGSTINNAGDIQLNTNNAIFNGSTGIAGSGTMSVQTNATATFNGTNFIDNAATIIGTVTGLNSSLALNGATTWAGGINTGSSTVIDFNNTLSITGTYDASGGSAAAAVAHGSTTIDANQNIITAAGGSDFTNASTGTFTMANNGSGIAGSGNFINQGTFTKSSSGTNTLDTVAFVNDSGNVAINSGNLAAVNGATYTQQQTGVNVPNTNLVSGASLGAVGSQLASATFNAGSLTGNGTLAAVTTTFNGGSTVSPGNNGIGTLNFNGDVVVNTGANYDLQLFSTPSTPGVSNDFLAISGSLQLPASGFTLTVSSIGTSGLINGFLDSGNYSWTIASAIGGITGWTGTNIALDLLGIGNSYTGTWSWSVAGNDLLLNYAAAFAPTPVPEPSTYAAFGVAICGTLVYLRRRQRARQSAAMVTTV